MKISLKITGLEITIDTDDAPGAISAQSIVDAISPLIVEPDLQAPAEPSAGVEMNAARLLVRYIAKLHSKELIA